MNSFIRHQQPFELPPLPQGQFEAVGVDRLNKGILHTVLLKSKPAHKTTTSEAVALNGLCKYCFLESMGGICGLVLMTPVDKTLVSPYSVRVGKPAASFSPLFHLQPQGIVVLESADSSLVFTANPTDSALVVGVNL